MARDPYRYFRIEARELVEQLGAGALELEKGVDPAPAVARLLRVAHTLKGAARVVKLPAVADLAHALEDALEPLRDAVTPVDRERVDALLALVDAIAAALPPSAEPAAPTAADATAPPATAADDPLPALQADRRELDALLVGLAEVHAQVAQAYEAMEPMGRLRAAVRHLGEQVAAERALSPAVGATVDELRGSLAALERDLTARLDRVARELGQSREAAERMRLLPAERLFVSLERTARDAAAAVGRRVTFVGTGGEVGLEGDVLAAVGAALVQAVRNAVAHGIEAPAARVAAGKDPVGRVTVAVSQRGSRVCFACGDDGAGVDVEAVRATAERRGMTAAEARALSTDELLRLLWRGGLTTARSVTALAGRGVGLDLVRAAAERLGGEVALRTAPGRGTTLEMVVPVLASSLEALVVEAAGQAVAVPLAATRGTARVTEAEVRRGPGGASVTVGGASVPLVWLRRLLRPSPGGGGGGRAWPLVAVVVEHGGARLALAVERLVGVDRVVLRPLPALTPAHPAVMGIWVDASGAARVALEPAGLLAVAGGLAGEEVGSPASRPRVLVIDDSLTTRMLEQSILESAGYEVDLAVSGEEGLARARERRYGLFLVDVEMPGMDGFAFVERARADEALRGVPAILVTSRASPEDRARGVAAGAAGHIEKAAFDQTDFIARVRGLIG